MGNSGLRKMLYPGDFVETKYDNLHQIKVLNLDKVEEPLAQFQNQVCICVNVSSFSTDFEKQLNQLKDLQAQYQENVSILAFPSNQFSNEPGNFQEIQEKYKNYQNENFKVFGKIEINGQYMHPVYKFLQRNSTLFDFKLVNSEQIREDFCQFIVNKDGQVEQFLNKNEDVEKDLIEIMNKFEQKE